MYKLHLIRKYLLKRRIAWVALVAVTLCTAMVLVVVSVMGGWLRNFEDSFHGSTGDVVIRGLSLGGFPHYQEMIDSIRKLPDAQAAVPIIKTFGLLSAAGGAGDAVQVLGYPPDIGEVNAWPSSLHLNQENRKKELQAATTQPGITDADRALLNRDIENLPFSLHPDIAYEDYAPPRAAARARNNAGIILSSTLPQIPMNDERKAADKRYDMYRNPVTLTLVPILAGEAPTAESVTSVPCWIVDDSHSQIWQLDNTNVYIAFDEAQRDLQMDEIKGKPATKTEDAVDPRPARCSEVQIKARPGADLNVLRDEVLKITDQVRANHAFDRGYDFQVQTWFEQQGTFIKAVKNEVVLTTLLFGIISMVAVLLIFCIFYMIVVEKTKDIGILKSVGATGTGILSLFLGYGFAIGVFGAGFGFGAAYYFVKYVNEIHGWFGARDWPSHLDS